MIHFFSVDPTLVLKSAVSVNCRETEVTGVIHPEKLTNMTIVDISVDNCPKSDFNVTGNVVTTTYDKCAKNVTQDANIITQVRNIFSFIKNNK